MAKNYYYIDDDTAQGPNTLLAIANESARFGIGATTSIDYRNSVPILLDNNTSVTSVASQNYIGFGTNGISRITGRDNPTSGSTSGFLGFIVGGVSEAGRFNYLGNLGIGTTNPGEKLQVDGNIRVGISTTSNYIAFRGTTADGTNASGDEDQSVGLKRWEHTYIGERIYESGTEKSELLLFKGNDNTISSVGPDRVRILAGEFRVDIINTVAAGTFEQVGNALSSNALIVTPTGNLGIGITNPTSKLHVSGNVTVTGSVSKGSGSFVIDHPLSETKNLVHSFIEGPRADLIYRGTVTLIGGSATINLDEEYELIPGTWKTLCRNPQVWISNIDGWTNCRGTVEDGILIIEAQTASNESVNWLVIAERQDKHMYDTEWTDNNGRPILEPVKL
jgi:hypothetical protein